MKLGNKRIAHRRGVTLIELLVVIGIIAILSAILITTTTGGTEAARAAKCMANMRALATAANAVAMEGRWYPFAGSCQYEELRNEDIYYYEWVGWISWLSNSGDPFGHLSGSAPKNPVSVKVCAFDTSNQEEAFFAITNGTLWRAVNRNRDVYTCPSHVKWCRQNLRTIPNWSYVMNMWFGYDYARGGDSVQAWDMRKEYAKLARADRLLMFAELPTSQSTSGNAKKDDKKVMGDMWMRDCTLQYKATINGTTRGASWRGTPEAIGFNHKANQGRSCGHVAFADGHVEKFIEPQGGGITVEQLTALLCEGKDVSFDGKGYQEIRVTD